MGKLMLAVRNNDIRTLKKCINWGEDVNQRDSNGSTALHVAAIDNSIEIVKILLDAGANFQDENKHFFYKHWTALHFAVIENHIAIVHFLLKAGAHLHAVNTSGWTALHMAVFMGHVDIVKLLLAKEGSKVNIAKKDGATPLTIAAHKNQLEITKVLISYGADSFAVTSALNIARSNNYISLIQLLDDYLKKPIILKEKWQKEVKESTQFILESVEHWADEKNQLQLLSIYQAIDGGYIPGIKMCLERGDDINQENDDFQTPLLIAIRGHFMEIIYLLLQRGANVDKLDNFGNTPLHNAIQIGDIEVVYLLLHADANVNLPNKNGMTPLGIAVEKFNFGAVKVLMAYGADPGQGTLVGSALEIAKKKKFISVIQLFEKYSHNPDVMRKQWRKEAEVPLQMVLNSCEQRLLTSRDVVAVSSRPIFSSPSFKRIIKLHNYIKNNDCISIIKCLKHIENIDEIGYFGNTALHIAAKIGNIKMFQIILDAGALIDTANFQGYTALHFSLDAEHAEIGHILLNKNAQVDVTTLDGFTPLHFAAERGLPIITHLLQAGATIDVINNAGETPLHLAAKKSLFITQKLIQAGASINLVEKRGMTPLHYAAQAGDQYIAHILLSAGAQIDLVDADGYTALHYAVKSKVYDLVLLLLYAGAKIDLVGRENAPLHLAVINQDIAISKLLLVYGADPFQSTTPFIMPIDIAKNFHNTTLINLFMEYENNRENVVENWRNKMNQSNKDIIKRLQVWSGHPLTALNLVPKEHIPSSSTTIVSTEHDSELEEFSSNSTESSTATNIEIPTHFLIEEKNLEQGKRLAEGRFGKVYQGIWLKHTSVAVKELVGTGSPSVLLASFKQEVAAMSKLKHDNIVKLYGVCIEQPYRIVMELMTKGSLYQVLHQGEKLDIAKKSKITEDIGKGLHYMHHLDPPMIHRDLKSLNILLDENYRAKLGDFGLTKFKNKLTSQSMSYNSNSPKQNAGTLAWKAPELLDLKPSYSLASDIYAYGMVIWEIFTEKLPYHEADDDNVVIALVKNGEREEIPEETPSQYKPLIKRCWAHRRDERPKIEEILEQLNVLIL